MASVQELLAALNARKSPLQSLIEGFGGGFEKGFSEAPERERARLAAQYEQEDRARAAETDKQLRAMMGLKQEEKTTQDFKKVERPTTPASPAVRLSGVATGAKGYLTPKFDVVDTREQMKEAQATKALAEGKMLPPPTVLNLNEGQAVARILPDVEQALLSNEKLFGPVVGRVGQANPYATQSQTVDARLRTASQAFGRFMEGGVLRKEDEEKYRKMFPQLQDTPPVAKNKLSIVRRQLALKYRSDKDALKGSGYDTSGFGELELPPSIFEPGGQAAGPGSPPVAGGLSEAEEVRYQELLKKQGGAR